MKGIVFVGNKINNIIEEFSYEKDKYYCARCGRNTHNYNMCYASTHIKGYQLKK